MEPSLAKQENEAGLQGDTRKPIPAVIPSQGFWPENTQEPQPFRGFRAIETPSVSTNDRSPLQLVNTQDLQVVQQNPSEGQAKENFKAAYGHAYDPFFAAFIRNQQQLQMAIQLDSSANSAQIRKINDMLMKKFLSE